MDLLLRNFASERAHTCSCSESPWALRVEVEAAIADIPGLREVAMIGLPHEAWGEIACAVVIMDANATALTVGTLRGHLKDRLAAFRHPRQIHARQEMLPRMTATGQIQRGKVKQEILAASR